MASIFKVWCTRKGADGSKVREKSKNWYGQFKDADGRTVRKPLCEDKTASQAMLTELIRKSNMVRSGLVDRFDDHRRRPLSEHIADFDTSMKSRGCCDEHRKIVVSKLRRVMIGCKFRYSGDISASNVEAFVAKIRKDENLSPQTCNFYVQAAKQFCKWMVEDARMALSPLAHLKRANVKVDQRRVRRELTDDEIARLLTATENGDVCSRLNGPDRAMLYRVALSTGLRAGELGSLTPKSFDLHADPPTVEIEPENEKAGRGAVLPIPDDLVTVLRPWLATRPSGSPVWPGRWSEQKRGASMMRHDLAAARQAWLKEAENDPVEREAREQSDFLCYFSHDGEQADFHALRHSFLSRLGRSGASPKELQRMARHASVEITLTRYVHASMFDLASAVNRLPSLPTGYGQGRGLRKTGS